MSGAPPDPGAAAAPRGPRRVSGGTLYKLVHCERRLWLDVHAPALAAPRDAHDEVLRERGRALEEGVARTFAGLEGPVLRPGVTLEDAARETRALLGTGRPLHQPVLLAADDRRVGVPDFLYWEDGRVVVREAKLALRPAARPDILLQLAHYGALAAEVAGAPVARLEVTNGRGETQAVTPPAPARLAAAVARAAALLGDAPEPDLLLAHSTCESCPFYAHCWDRAQAERRVEVLSEVWRSRAAALHAEGVCTFDELAARDPGSLRHPELRRGARRIVAEARAHANGAPVWLEPPRLPAGRQPVWFDLEGDPDGEAAEVPIYLWGLAVEEADAPRPEAVFADLDAGGDRRGWERFVARALEIAAAAPHAVWVHWHQYEVTWLHRYQRRYGAPAAFERALLAPGATFDLHAALHRAVRLPLRSYSIKHVAPWLGFAWSIPESGSAWSVAQFHHARATADPEERARRLAAIARYNADDLLAMRAVWRWLEANAPRAPAGAEHA
ncbi:MAG TPA: TM0106 family RecB-like putative nuclease [Candidatus Eisenbacteria bacterium]|nr:TM0106 family RecB-like putative nuclease [Candidatus Eisenbacteria bacterium]